MSKSEAQAMDAYYAAGRLGRHSWPRNMSRILTLHSRGENALASDRSEAWVAPRPRLAAWIGFLMSISVEVGPSADRATLPRHGHSTRETDDPG
jgi:hypothetical protein